MSLANQLEESKQAFLESWDIFKKTGEINDGRMFSEDLDKYLALLNELEFEPEVQ